jgi:hypothetical protein
MPAHNLDLGQLAKGQLQLIAQLAFELLLKLGRQHPVLGDVEHDADPVG